MPADYVRSHLRLGYVATAHGHQTDTVDISLAVVTEASSHRSLYVATSGRPENRLLVVTDDADAVAARDVLERVLTNDRADVPPITQRRNLARQVARTTTPEALVAAKGLVAAARATLSDVRRRTARHSVPPDRPPKTAAESRLHTACENGCGNCRGWRPFDISSEDPGVEPPGLGL